MTECTEIAHTMIPAWHAFLAAGHYQGDMDAARHFVRTQMPDESATVIDSVAEALTFL